MSTQREDDAHSNGADESRRDFLKTATLVGGAAALGTRRFAINLSRGSAGIDAAANAAPGHGDDAGKGEPLVRAGVRQDRPLGVFQQEADALDRDRFRRLCDDRMLDASGRRRSGTHDQRRSGGGKRLSLDQGQEERGPAWRRPDGRSQRCWRWLWRPHHDRADRYPRGQGGGHPRSPRPRHVSASLRQSQYKGKTFGTNIAAWWGYQYNDWVGGEKPREIVTIYELESDGSHDWATSGPQLSVGTVYRPERRRA
jgi:hypothetical protein